MSELKPEALSRNIEKLSRRITQEIFELDEEGRYFDDKEDSGEWKLRRMARWGDEPSPKQQRVENRLSEMRADGYQAGAPLGAALSSALDVAKRYSDRRDGVMTPNSLVKALDASRKYCITADPILFHPVSEVAGKKLQALPLRAIRQAELMVRNSSLTEPSQAVIKLVLQLTESYRRQQKTIPVEDIDGASELYHTLVYCLDQMSTQAAEPAFLEETIPAIQEKLLSRFPNLSAEALTRRASRTRLHVHHLSDVESGWEFKVGNYDKSIGVIHLSVADRHANTDQHETLHALSYDADTERFDGLDYFPAKLLEEAIIETANGELGATGALSYPNERAYLKGLQTWQHDLLRGIPQPGRKAKPLSLDLFMDSLYGDRNLPKALRQHGYSRSEANRLLRITNGLFQIADLQQKETVKTNRHYDAVKPEWLEQYRQQVGN